MKKMPDEVKPLEQIIKERKIKDEKVKKEKQKYTEPYKLPRLTRPQMKSLWKQRRPTNHRALSGQ